MRSVILISTFEKAKNYIKAVERNNEDIQAAWHRCMIEPFWAEISKWAPHNIDYMKPVPIKNIEALKKQIEIFSQISTHKLHSEFVRIISMLPQNDDDPVLAALFPLCDDNSIVKKRQNGVLGACVFGNIIININPLADNYCDWIPFVFAHEYHHSVLGHSLYALRGGEGLDGSFYENMIIEGQADLFAESLFPDLVPQWNRPFSDTAEKRLWERLKTDPTTHESCMFGDEKRDLPWCMGYSLGRAIVSDYMRRHPNVSFGDLLNVLPAEILNGSRFN